MMILCASSHRTVKIGLVLTLIAGIWDLSMFKILLAVIGSYANVMNGCFPSLLNALLAIISIS